MISSRNTDLIPDTSGAISLSKVRVELQDELQGEEFLGRTLLDVWVNEDSGESPIKKKTANISGTLVTTISRASLPAHPIRRRLQPVVFILRIRIEAALVEVGLRCRRSGNSADRHLQPVVLRGLHLSCPLDEKRRGSPVCP
jgi:hypothetical protein